MQARKFFSLQVFQCGFIDADKNNRLETPIILKQSNYK